MNIKPFLGPLMRFLKKYNRLYQESPMSVNIDKGKITTKEISEFIIEYKKLSATYPGWFVGFSLDMEYANDSLMSSLVFGIDGETFTIRDFRPQGRIETITQDSRLRNVFLDLEQAEETAMETSLITNLLNYLSTSPQEKERFSWTISMDLRKASIEESISEKFGYSGKDIRTMFFADFANLADWLSSASVPTLGDTLIGSNSALIVLVGGFDAHFRGPSLLAIDIDHLDKMKDELLDFTNNFSSIEPVANMMSRLTKHVYPSSPVPPSLVRAGIVTGENAKNLSEILMSIMILGFLQLIATSVVPLDEKTSIITIAGERTLNSTISLNNGSVLLNGMKAFESFDIIKDTLEWLLVNLSQDKIQILRSAVLHNIESIEEIGNRMKEIYSTAKSIFRIHIDSLSSTSVQMHQSFLENIQKLSSASAEYLLKLNSDLKEAALGTIALVTAGLIGWVTSSSSASVQQAVLAWIPILIALNFTIAYFRVKSLLHVYDAYQNQHEKLLGYYRPYVPSHMEYGIVEPLSKAQFKSRANWFMRIIGGIVLVVIFLWICIIISSGLG